MLWVPQKGIVRVQHNYGATGVALTSLGTSVTTHATDAATKGTPAQIFAATDFDAYWIEILAHSHASNAADSAGCLDILVGAATEEVLIPNLLMGYCGQGYGGKRWAFPLYIPAGTRIAAQVAGSRLGATCRVGITLYGGNGIPPFRPGSRVTTYGIGTVPFGTAITPGASGAEGSWTQITASTSRDHFAFVPSFSLTSETSATTKVYFVDMGSGAATEEEFHQSAIYYIDSAEFMAGPIGNLWPTFKDIPSGTRLVMRASNNGVNDDAYNGAIHAVS